MELTLTPAPGVPELELGESPHWCERRGVLYFVDIQAHRIYRYDPVTALCEFREVPGEPGFVIPYVGADEDLLIGLPDGLYRLPWDGEPTRLIAVFPDRDDVRINDAACDSTGRVWFGTMNRGTGEPAGMLLSFDGVELLSHDGPLGCWNGIGWDPSETTLYAVDTLGREIRSYPFINGARERPRLGAPVVRALPGQAGGLPDGLAVDRGGCLWVALWDGASLLLLDGERSEILGVPGGRPTAPALLPGGRIAVTSARSAAAPGTLFLSDPGAVSARAREVYEFSPRGGA